jgi:hypothetical protein
MTNTSNPPRSLLNSADTYQQAVVNKQKGSCCDFDSAEEPTKKAKTPAFSIAPMRVEGGFSAESISYISIDLGIEIAPCQDRHAWSRWEPSITFSTEGTIGRGMRCCQAYLAHQEEPAPRKRDQLYRRLCRGWYIGTQEGNEPFLDRWLGDSRSETEGRQPRAYGEDAATVLLGKGLSCLHRSSSDLDQDRKGSNVKDLTHPVSFELTTRFRLTPSSAASRTSLRWTSGGTRTMNLPLYRRDRTGCGTGS